MNDVFADLNHIYYKKYTGQSTIMRMDSIIIIWLRILGIEMRFLGIELCLTVTRESSSLLPVLLFLQLHSEYSSKEMATNSYLRREWTIFALKDGHDHENSNEWVWKRWFLMWFHGSQILFQVQQTEEIPSKGIHNVAVIQLKHGFLWWISGYMEMRRPPYFSTLPRTSLIDLQCPMISM